jgi:hypothetical protein
VLIALTGWGRTQDRIRAIGAVHRSRSVNALARLTQQLSSIKERLRINSYLNQKTARFPMIASAYN